MDMKKYWGAVYAKAAELAGAPPHLEYERAKPLAMEHLGQMCLVKSLATEDGGQPAQIREMDLLSAAKSIVDERAVPASPEEFREYQMLQEQQRAQIRRENAARKLHIQVVEQSEVHGFITEPPSPVAEQSSARRR